MIKQLLNDIHLFLKDSGMTATQFGVDAVGSRNFVGDLRRGKGCTVATYEKARAYLAGQTKEQAHD